MWNLVKNAAVTSKIGMGLRLRKILHFGCWAWVFSNRVYGEFEV